MQSNPSQFWLPCGCSNYDAERIAEWNTSGASLEATGCRHGSSSCAISPRRPSWSLISNETYKHYQTQFVASNYEAKKKPPTMTTTTETVTPCCQKQNQLHENKETCLSPRRCWEGSTRLPWYLTTPPSTRKKLLSVTPKGQFYWDGVPCQWWAPTWGRISHTNRGQHIGGAWSNLWTPCR
jgi:hypothetical protein